MGIDHYSFAGSPPCRTVLMVAKELNIPLNLKEVDILAGKQLDPDFLKLNPQHCIPTIDDDGFVLWESRAIITYMVNKYSPGHSLYPSDPQKRAEVDRLLNFDIGTLYPAQVPLIRPMIFEGKDMDPEAEKVFREKLALFDSFLEGKPYLTGENYTLADLSIFSALVGLEVWDFDMSAYENVVQWIARLKALPYYEEINGEPLKQFKLYIESKKQTKQ